MGHIPRGDVKRVQGLCVGHDCECSVKHVEQRYVNACSRPRRTCSMFKAVTSCNPRRQQRAACSRRQHAGIQDGNVQRVRDHFFGLAGKDLAPAFHFTVNHCLLQYCQEESLG